MLGALGLIIIAVAVLAIIGFLFINRPAEILQGQAEATAVRVSGKLPGRIVDFYVREGRHGAQGRHAGAHPLVAGRGQA